MPQSFGTGCAVWLGVASIAFCEALNVRSCEMCVRREDLASRDQALEPVNSEVDGPCFREGKAALAAFAPRELVAWARQQSSWAGKMPEYAAAWPLTHHISIPGPATRRNEKRFRASSKEMFSFTLIVMASFYFFPRRTCSRVCCSSDSGAYHYSCQSCVHGHHTLRISVGLSSFGRHGRTIGY